MSARNRSEDDVTELTNALRPKSPWYVSWILLPMLMSAPGLLLGLIAIGGNSDALCGAGLIGFILFSAAGAAVLYGRSNRVIL